MSQPVVDGELGLSSPAFLPADPRTLVESGEYLREVDLLLGVNSEEGILITQFLQVAPAPPPQALPALYPAVAAAWSTLGPFALFARWTVGTGGARVELGWWQGDCGCFEYILFSLMSLW